MRRILTLFMLLSLSLSFAFAQGKPFKGFWEKDTTDEYHALYIDLYGKSLKTPDKSAASYGYLQSENEFNSDVWVITQVLSLQGNNAKVKTFSWRYGSPNDQVEATLTYNPATKVMTYQRSDFPITFQPTPPINSLVLRKTYRNRDIKHELVFLSFEKRDGWVFINEESSSVYEDGRISHSGNTVYAGKIKGNRIVCTYKLNCFLPDLSSIQLSEMEKTAPCILTYSPASKTFVMNGVLFEVDNQFPTDL